MKQQIFNLDAVTLIYRSKSGDTFLQSLNDLAEVGSLIDPDTDEDMLIIGAEFDPEKA